MITIFTIPKPFIGHINTIQRNAIRSWLQLKPACEIILFGDEPGISDLSSELGLVHIPQINKNEFGTPLLNDAFKKAQEIASFPEICYVNADIILTNNFTRAIQSNNFERYLIIGRRIDLDIHDEIIFDYAEWETELKKDVEQRGHLHGYRGIDYFIFPKGLLIDLPPFAVGRAGWDNWLIYHVKRELNVPVIDATNLILAVHQNHDYGHVPLQRGNKYEGFESDRNFAYIGRYDHKYNILDANFVLTKEGVRRNPVSLQYLRQILYERPLSSPLWQKIVKTKKKVWK